MSTFASLKKNSSLSKLTKALQQTNKKNNSADDRFWQPEVDKAGNGFAVIRFLDAPAADGDDGMPWVQLFTHGFEGPGGWYIENSLTTLGLKDPVSEENSRLWKTEIKANQDIARDRKRRLSYISNILVVKDAAHPENEGKVFLYSYGKKIFDKIKSAIDPTEEEIDLAAKEGITLVPVNIFSFWEGHNFNLKIRKVEGYRNYDTSAFVGMATTEGPAKGTPIAKTDAAIEEIWKSAYSLKELISPDKFKSYQELEAKMNKVLGLDGSKPVSNKPVQSKELPANPEEDSTPPFDPDPPKEEAKAKAAAPKKAEVKSPPKEEAKAPATEDDDSDMLSMFQNLAK